MFHIDTLTLLSKFSPPRLPFTLHNKQRGSLLHVDDVDDTHWGFFRVATTIDIFGTLNDGFESFVAGFSAAVDGNS